MGSAMRYVDVEVDAQLPPQTFSVQRADLVRYAGASGDFNVIHWSERQATALGLPTVIAHGMFTMAVALRVVTDWVGDPGCVLEYSTRFSKPVPVPDDDRGALVTVTGRVEDKLEDDRVVVLLSASIDGGDAVLSGARAVVQLA
jgi:acyl dehydratase